MLIWEAKDPDEVVDYAIDWESRLSGDTISSASFSVVSGTMTIADSDYDTRFTVVTLAGGTTGAKSKILCEIETTDGQTMQETASLVARAR